MCMECGIGGVGRRKVGAWECGEMSSGNRPVEMRRPPCELSKKGSGVVGEQRRRREL